MKKPRKRKPYVQPRLTRYGSVALLTRTGTKGANETGGMMFVTLKSTSTLQVKESLERVGTHPLGFGLYLFDYKPEFRDRFGQGRQFGVIAEEVAPVFPDAVERGPDGYLTVDYALLGVTRYKS